MSTETARTGMPGRLLRLLALLQSRREWSGAELAGRLGVTTRTVRRDIDRLRALDYPVDSVTGTAGGYRLVSGTSLPPLLLDDDEATAVAVGLITAPGSVAGIGESSVRALAKLEQVLPARVRPRLAAVSGTTAAVGYRHVTPAADPSVLAVLASCCRDHEILSFGYSGRDGQTSTRRAEPHNLVTAQGFWYLLAYDPDRDGWRTFRVDRITGPLPTHRHFTPRELPAPDAATFLTRSFATARYRHTASITVALPAETVRARLFAPIPGEITADGDECTIRLSADSPELVVQYIAAIAALGADFTLHADDDITRRVHNLGQSLTT